MQQQPDPLSKIKPLADPLRVIVTLLITCGIFLGVVYTISGIVEFGLGALLMGLAPALIVASFAILIAPGGRPNAIYLRAFKTDLATAKLRAQLAAILGTEYRLSGIRPPRERSSVFLRFMLPGIMALRYAGSKFMELEAGDDWMARLWKTYQTTRLVFIDIRETTPNVYLEIRMTLETMGTERCVFIVGPDKTAETWRQTIAAIVGPDFNATNFQLLDASDPQMERHLTEVIQRLPAGLPGETDRGRKFVLAHVDPQDLAKSRQFSAGAVVSAVAALALSVILGNLPDQIEPFVELPIVVITLLLVGRAFLRGIRRARLLSRFGHGGAARRAASMLVVAFLPYLGSILVMTVAIPTMKKARAGAQEQSAINSLRVISQAQLQYNTEYPDHGFACRLSQLAGDQTAGTPSADAAQFIPPDLAEGKKAGYHFTLTCTQETVSGHLMATAFKVTAVPDVSGKIKQRGFCLDENGVITADPNGGTNCTEPLK